MATRPLIAVGELGGSLCLGRQAARGETRTDLQITGQTAGMAPFSSIGPILDFADGVCEICLLTVRLV